ncbi:MAG: hypothetical protein V5A44_09780 [Haloarculaceae archaeon]
MAREVRITIDDDEVFERMKARKRELDLSWEEVLKRGLRDEGSGGDQEWAAGPGREPGTAEFVGWSPETGWQGTSSGRGPQRREDADLDDVVDEFKESIRGQVRESLRASMAAMDDASSAGRRKSGTGGGLDREMTELEQAEDAVLRFDDVTDDDRRFAVPLRVRLETSRDGMDVEVVAVREGKSVADTNRFDRSTRRAVNEHLARGGTATLAFDGAEAYEVGPVLSWSRDDGGNPTVSEVSVEEVLFDE